QHAPVLHCVIHLPPERALEEAHRAELAISEGRPTGPLHGVPWGATPYTSQRIEADAAAVERLGAAGAVLVAKLSLGALAWGDVWFGGTTRNPWKPEQGSSGSSAGSAAAVAAGLAGFAVGSETWGSIVSPCTRCGATGLRPTFGLVSRHGAMALSWSMDKLGPIARDVTDCALVLEQLAGPDPRDLSLSGRSFVWDRDLDPTGLRVGVIRSAFDEERDDAEWRRNDLDTLAQLEALGLDLVEMELPTGDLPVESLSFVLSVEAAAAFDELTRSGADDQLVRQVRRAWPNVFRQARFIPAVEYVQANRIRTLLGRRMAQLERKVDVWICPSYGAGNLLLTNLTGLPSVVLPNGFRADGTPTSITFNGHLFGESAVLAVARAYQDTTGFHRRSPPLERTVPEPGEEG
ncbi:MAG: amidase, partial [Holophagales bacterium]|nr:amidase [Holophagales bacterium]